MNTELNYYEIGKYGRMRLAYLKEHRRGTYTTLLTEFKLNEHLHEIDIQAKETVSRITAELAAKRGITETLKEADPMRWVREMNNCKACAEETVREELIFA